MKKWCVAAAMAVVSGAWAQSSVTVSGLVDVYVGSMRMAGDTGRKSVVDSGGMTTSYFGFSGIEDLGGGLAAGFKLGSFFRADSGQFGRFNGDTNMSRDANVFLTGKFGTLTLGRAMAPNFLPTILFNPFGDSFAFSPLVLHANVSTTGWPYTTSTADTGWSNQVTYSIPTWGGLSANVHYQFGEQIGTGLKHKGNAGIDVMYRNGPLALTAIYERAQIVNPAGTTLYAGNDTRKDWMLGATYDFSVVKLFLTYGEAERAATNQKFKTAQAGVSIPVGAGKILASVAQTRRTVPVAFTGVAPIYSLWVDGYDKSKRTTATVGYDYFLSKRTDLYVNVMHDRVTDLTSGTSVGLGMRHRF